MKTHVTTLIKLALTLVILNLLQACTSVDNPRGYSVAEAYDSSGVMTVNPYTRTIFSSSNF